MIFLSRQLPCDLPIISGLKAVTHEEGDALEKAGADIRHQTGEARGPGPVRLVDVHREVLRQDDCHEAELGRCVRIAVRMN